MELTQNMRVMASGDPELEDFDKWTLGVGNGDSDVLEIPTPMVSTVIHPNSKSSPMAEGKSKAEFCDKVFPDLALNINDQDFVEGRAILTSTNKEALMVNEYLTSKLPGNADVLRSADQVTDSDDELRFTTEYLNAQTPNGFPPHALFLKPGMPLMLLRNLNPKEGLCNGTKLIYEETIDRKVLRCRVSGSGKTALIPRICFIPKAGEYAFYWSRLQFPVKVRNI